MVDSANVAYVRAAGTDLGVPSGGVSKRAPLLVQLYPSLNQTEPTIFKSLLAVDISSETTIWTPEAGKKFRLLGLVITQGTLTGDITLRDDTAGSTILVIPATPVGQPLAVSLGRVGLLSATADYVLTAEGESTETISGFIYGTEE
jgi:hypothetical protein